MKWYAKLTALIALAGVVSVLLYNAFGFSWIAIQRHSCNEKLLRPGAAYLCEYPSRLERTKDSTDNYMCRCPK